MIKAVLFDYGGVLKIGHPLSMDTPKIFNMTQEEFDRVRKDRLEVVSAAEKGLISDEEFWVRLSKIVGKPVPKNPVEQAAEFYRETFVFIPEIFNLAVKLREAGIKTGILSNIYKFEADVIREKNGYDGFDPVILSYEVGTDKPEPEIYKLAVEKTGFRPDECLFVDDKEGNLPPAQSIGIKTVLFKNSQQAIKDINSIINSEK